MAARTKIIDIRVDTAQSDVVADIKRGLRPKDGGEKTLPTLLLYSEAGLKLFEKITYLDEVRTGHQPLTCLSDRQVVLLDKCRDRSIGELCRPDGPAHPIRLDSG
jgi:uncharacterized SAM-dependent methyltransferase